MSEREDYSLMAYYSELTVYDRQVHDARRVADQPNAYLFERVFPICATPTDVVKLKEALPLLERLSQILQEAPQRAKWPKCLRCCCCRNKTRTSCCGYRTTILFGQIKQLGIILKT